MEYKSILLNNVNYISNKSEFFHDLSIDDIIEGVLKNKYDIDKNIFLARPKTIDDVKYRQEIFYDIETPETYKLIDNFIFNFFSLKNAIKNIDEYYDKQRYGVILSAIENYISTLINFYNYFLSFNNLSRGLSNFREYLKVYMENNDFKEMEKDTSIMRKKISEIKYNMEISSDKITVFLDNDNMDDYTVYIKSLFEKFTEKEEEIKNETYMSHVGAHLLNFIYKFYNNTFLDLKKFCKKYENFIDNGIDNFYNEIKCYMAYENYIGKLKKTGLNFCLPDISCDDSISGKDCFDLSLAHKNYNNIVENNFNFVKNENIIIITGPNNGGKTTFVRMIGQMLFLGNLGLPVPGKHAKLNFYDNIYTHFEKSENLDNLRGKLEDDLQRIKIIIEKSTKNSIIIINEMLSSAMLSDASLLGEEIIKMMKDKRSRAFYVTFIDSLSDIDDSVRMSAQVNENFERTYKIIKDYKNRSAYAKSLADKYNLTKGKLMERIK